MKLKICAVILLIVVVLTGCGKETFRCGLCMKQVTQVPHEVTIFGQDVCICDSCYEYLK